MKITIPARSFTLPSQEVEFDVPADATLTARVGELETGLAAVMAELQSPPAPPAPPAPVPPAPATPTLEFKNTNILLDATGFIDARLVTQLAESVSANNKRLAELGGVSHTNGTDWIREVKAPDGKDAWRFRIHKDQQTFQGATQRAELFSGYLSTEGVKEGNDYLMALDWYFDEDMFDTGGTHSAYGPDSISLFDLHGQPGFGTVPASSYHGMAFRLNRARQLTFHTFAEQGSTPGKTYNVTNGPSSTVIAQVNSQPGGPHGTPNTYIIDTNARANQWYRVVVRMKLAAGSGGQLQVYRKIGAGPFAKVIDSQEPNIGPAFGSYRFLKEGIYKFDNTWGSKPSRSFLQRSWAVMPNTTTPEALLAWMER